MSGSFKARELLADFLAEAGELLCDVDLKLVELERQPQDADLLNAIFRGFHTIKGGAGFLEAAALVALCHRTETLFDKLRSGELGLDAVLMDLILDATGEVRRMFGEMEGGALPGDAPQALLDALEPAASGLIAPEPQEARAVAEANTVFEPDWAALLAAIVPAAEKTTPATLAAPKPRPAVQAPSVGAAAPVALPPPARVDAPRPAHGGASKPARAGAAPTAAKDATLRSTRRASTRSSTSRARSA